MIYVFEDYSLDTDRRELRRAAKLVAAEPQVFDFLAYLISNRERVVSKDDLIAAVWGGRIVSESAVSSKITAVRHAVGDTGEEQRLIRTLPRKGIRFVGTVREDPEPADVAVLKPSAVQEAKPPRQPKSVGGAADLPAASPATAAARAPSPTPPLPDRPSIAVLPFANMSGDSAQDYIADGIVEDITTELSRFRELFVIARNSSFHYKGRAADVRQIGRELGVRYVLEGSIRYERHRHCLRINAQLIDAMTGAHRWAERYDRDVKDVFAVQDEIARTVAANLAAHVNKAEAERTLLKPPNSWHAYDYYMRAAETYAAFHRPMEVAAIYETRRLLDQCLASEPEYARAHVLYSSTKVSTWALRLDGDHLDPAALEIAHHWAEKAVQRDPNLPQAHAQMGYVLSFRAMPDAAVAQFERAIELNPNFTDWRFSSILACAGLAERAMHVAEAHLRVDPYALPIARGHLGLAYLFLGRYSEAIPPLLEFVAQSPNHRAGRVWLTATYAHLGQLDEARNQAAEILRLDPDFIAARTFRRMSTYWRPKDVEHVLHGLRKAGLPVA